MKLKFIIKSTVLLSLVFCNFSANSAIALDRTRAIYPGDAKAIIVNISNDNKKQPYLAQAWLENEAGEKINSPFVVSPPLQRVEPGKKSVLKISKTPDAKLLPQDRESVFYFNVREIPPRSDKPNVMQLALQTKIKLFYRPESIIPEKNTRWDNKLVLYKVNGGYKIENPTPYYMTVIGIGGADISSSDKHFTPQMIKPKSSAIFKTKVLAKPYVRTINDFGGKPKLGFTCNGDRCVADADE